MTPNYQGFLLLGINPAGEVAMVKFFKAEHHYSRVFTTIFACLISDLSEPVLADESPVWKVEEDGELKTYQSDPSIFSLQITFFSTPDDGDTETYFQLQMNYSADNNFSADGFQVAVQLANSGDDIMVRVRVDLNQGSWVPNCFLFSNGEMVVKTVMRRESTN